MAIIIRKNYKKKPTKVVKKRFYKRKPYTSIKKSVRNVINKMAETKVVKTTAERSMIWDPNATLWQSRNLFWSGDVLSFISQGTGQGNRVGNQIMLKSLTMSFILWSRLSNAPGPVLPFDVCMFVFTDKLKPTQSSLTDVRNAFAGIGGDQYFFQSGNASTGQNLTITDQMLHVNDDRFTLHYKRIFKIGTSNQTNWNNNDYSVSRKFKINLAKYMPRYVKFADATSTPQTRQVYVAFMPVVANDDTTVIVSNTECVNIGFDIQATYKDV
jgi:hypothetical protein